MAEDSEEEYSGTLELRGGVFEKWCHIRRSLGLITHLDVAGFLVNSYLSQHKEKLTDSGSRICPCSKLWPHDFKPEVDVICAQGPGAQICTKGPGPQNCKIDFKMNRTGGPGQQTCSPKFDPICAQCGSALSRSCQNCIAQQLQKRDLQEKGTQTVGLEIAGFSPNVQQQPVENRSVAAAAMKELFTRAAATQKLLTAMPKSPAPALRENERMVKKEPLRKGSNDSASERAKAVTEKIKTEKREELTGSQLQSANDDDDDDDDRCHIVPDMGETEGGGNDGISKTMPARKNKAKPSSSRILPKRSCFICNLCSVSMTTERQLLVHKRHFHKIMGEKDDLSPHKVRQTFSCGLCKKCFLHPKSLQRHMRQGHADSNGLADATGVEKKSDTKRASRWQNRAADSGLETVGVGEVKYESRVDGEGSGTHNGKCDENPAVLKPSFTCSVCSYKLPSEKTLQTHVQRWHSQRRNPRGRFCTDPKEKPYPCDACGRCFSRLGNLNRHMRESHQSRAKPGGCCERCGRKFRFQVCLDVHLQQRHCELAPTFICSACGVKRRSQKNLDLHVQKAHSPGDQPASPMCSECGRQFSCRSGLNKHIKEVHHRLRPNRCTVCSKGFYSSYALNCHMNKHTGDRPFVCDVCGKAYRTTGALTNHRKTHVDGSQFECTVCHKTYGTERYLKQHMKVSHSANPPIYTCALCPKSYHRKDLLVRHQVIHTGAKKYVCEFCNKAFAFSNALRDHRMLHMDYRPHLCNVCHKAFAIAREMRRHKKQAHGIIEVPPPRRPGNTTMAEIEMMEFL